MDVKVHDEFYKELHDCFGIESCIKQANMLGGPPQSKLFLKLINLILVDKYKSEMVKNQ